MIQTSSSRWRKTTPLRLSDHPVCFAASCWGRCKCLATRRSGNPNVTRCRPLARSCPRTRICGLMPAPDRRLGRPHRWFGLGWTVSWFVVATGSQMRKRRNAYRPDHSARPEPQATRGPWLRHGKSGRSGSQSWSVLFVQFLRVPVNIVRTCRLTDTTLNFAVDNSHRTRWAQALANPG